MSTKNILISLGGVVVIGGALFFAMPKDGNAPSPQPQEQAQNSSQAGITETSQTPTATPSPTKDASSDQIIDYLVDDIASDETKTAQNEINTVTPANQSSPTINTDF